MPDVGTMLERILRDTLDSEARVLYVRNPLSGERWGIVLRRGGEITGLGYGPTLVSALIRARKQDLEGRDGES